MTDTELKAQIDSQITNETSPSSISPADVGGNLKAVVDFTVQEIKTKVLKTTITTAQVLDLFTTPITVLDSSDPLTVKLPVNIWVQRQAGDAYTLATTSFSLINDSGAAVSANINPNPLTGVGIGFFTSYFDITQNAAGVDRNFLYQLKANTGNPTSGTGDLDVYISYIEITL